MTYEEGILGMPKQFEYKAEVINKEKIRPYTKVVVLGMGGSRLAGDILNMIKPELDILIHSDYDLPTINLEDALIVANSYSGNTAEVISGAKMAIEKDLNLVVVSSGGELNTLASNKQIPYITLPHSDLQPRMMIGHDLMALVELLGLDSPDLKNCLNIDANSLKPSGMQVARQIGSAIPLIYTSERFNELGYIWKIVLNETAKMPAFHNRLPEANHNEIASFQGDWASGFHSIFLKDNLDSRISQRMDLTADLFRKHEMLVAIIPLEGDSVAEKIIKSVLIAHWAALELANTNNIEPLTVPEIEDFKKDLKKD
ncbi:MAG: hypothetical protein KBC81_01460 [Candidatus Pacebacteria bacterium]|nr:hypothetical protein [Candidatus Paceibacterota bacterium]